MSNITSRNTAERVQLGLGLLQATAISRNDEVLIGASHDRIHAKLATTETYDLELKAMMESLGWQKAVMDDGYDISV
jgi:hypothetical protein